MTQKETRDAVEILRRRYIGTDKRRQASARNELINAEVARQVYDARKRAGLSQQQLAQLVGTKQSVISRLEDADYGGHTVRMLKRIAQGLGQELGISIADERPSSSTMANAQLDGELEQIMRGCPAKEMVKRDWLPPWDKLQELEASLRAFLGPAPSLRLARFRASRPSKADRVALLCWLTKVQTEAERITVGHSYGRTAKREIGELAKLSARNDGPLRAVEWLEDRGIRCVFVRHLPRTYVDGAATLLDDGEPAIALTFRQNRLDNFWFTLLHEIGHVLLHHKELTRSAIVDERIEEVSDDKLENQANRFAGNAWVDPGQWRSFRHKVGDRPRLSDIVSLAARLEVSPALVAGRLRHELNRWTHYGRLVGQGRPRATIARKYPVF